MLHNLSLKSNSDPNQTFWTTRSRSGTSVCPSLWQIFSVGSFGCSRSSYCFWSTCVSSFWSTAWWCHSWLCVRVVFFDIHYLGPIKVLLTIWNVIVTKLPLCPLLNFIRAILHHRHESFIDFFIWLSLELLSICLPRILMDRLLLLVCVKERERERKWLGGGPWSSLCVYFGDRLLGAVWVCMPLVLLGNWFAVIAASPEFIAGVSAESCPRWTEVKMEMREAEERMKREFEEESERTHGGWETKGRCRRGGDGWRVRQATEGGREEMILFMFTGWPWLV